VRAIIAVNAGAFFVSPGIIAGSVDEEMIPSIPKGMYERLSKRELEVLNQVAAGCTSSAIARRLSLSTKTVDTYRGQPMTQLGVQNRSELIRFVIENRLTGM